MRIETAIDGTLLLRELDPIEVDTLRRVPLLLESDDPRVRERLLPNAYDDPSDEAQWRELVVPELEHLFADHTRIVRKDLSSLSIEPDGRGFRIAVPAQHRSAWEAALTGASHALYLLADLRPVDTEHDPIEIEDPDRQIALIRIRVLGYVLSELLEADGYV